MADARNSRPAMYMPATARARDAPTTSSLAPSRRGRHPLGTVTDVDRQRDHDDRRWPARRLRRSSSTTVRRPPSVEGNEVSPDPEAATRSASQPGSTVQLAAEAASRWHADHEPRARQSGVRPAARPSRPVWDPTRGATAPSDDGGYETRASASTRGGAATACGAAPAGWRRPATCWRRSASARDGTRRDAPVDVHSARSAVTADSLVGAGAWPPRGRLAAPRPIAHALPSRPSTGRKPVQRCQAQLERSRWMPIDAAAPHRGRSSTCRIRLRDAVGCRAAESRRAAFRLVMPTTGCAGRTRRCRRAGAGRGAGTLLRPATADHADARIGDVMTRKPRVIQPDATVADAAALMRRLDVGALPVCDGSRLIGHAHRPRHHDPRRPPTAAIRT